MTKEEFLNRLKEIIFKAEVETEEGIRVVKEEVQDLLDELDEED